MRQMVASWLRLINSCAVRLRSSQFRGWALGLFWGVGRTHRWGKDPGREEDPPSPLVADAPAGTRPGPGFPVGDKPAEGTSWSPWVLCPGPWKEAEGEETGMTARNRGLLDFPEMSEHKHLCRVQE